MSLINTMFLFENYKYLRKIVLENKLKPLPITLEQASILIDYGIKTDDKELVIRLINIVDHKTGIKALKYLINNHYSYLVEDYKKNYKNRFNIRFYLTNFLEMLSDDLIKAKDEFFLLKLDCIKEINGEYLLFRLDLTNTLIKDEQKLERLKDYIISTSNKDLYYVIVLLYSKNNKDIPEDLINKILEFNYEDLIYSLKLGKNSIKCICNEKNMHHLEQIFQIVSKMANQKDFYFDNYFQYIKGLQDNDLKHELLKKLLILNISDHNKLYALYLELKKFNDFYTISLIINKFNNEQKENILKDALKQKDLNAVNLIISDIPCEIQEKVNLEVVKNNDIAKMLILAVTTETTSTYQLIDILIDLDDSINIYLINNTKGRFNSYTISGLINKKGPDYILYLLNQLYLLESVGFIYLIRFIVGYNYLKLFNKEDQEVIMAYYKEKEDLALALKK